MPRIQNIRSLYQVNQASFDPYVINVMDEKYWRTELSGIVTTDGKSRPLAGYFSSLETARAAYPRFASGITSLAMQIDTCAIMEAYLGAIQLNVDNDINNFSSYFADDHNSINPALIIPRRYYRVDLDKVWFYGDVDIYGEGAVLIGHSVNSSGKNYYQYPSSGQEPAAGAILTIGASYDAINKPSYIHYVGGESPYSINYYLPDVVSDAGLRNWDMSSSLNTTAKGTGVRIGGMIDCNVHMGKISGMLRYGLLWHPIEVGANFNRIYLRMIASCLYSIKFATSNESWIIGNQMYGGWARMGIAMGTNGQAFNSGIIVDFCYDPSKDGNFPYPSGYTARRWRTGDLLMEGFSPEDPWVKTYIRLDFCNDILFSKWRGERANFNTSSGIIPNNIWIPSGPKILVENTTYGNVSNIRIDDWSHADPDIQYIYSGSSYSNEYNHNVVSLNTRSYNMGNSGDLVRYYNEEQYNTRPGAGPILTSSDGKKAFRLMVKETDGSYTLTPQEVGLPACAIRATTASGVAGTGTWNMLRDGLNVTTFQVPVSGWIEIKSYAGRTAQSTYDISFSAVRHIAAGTDYDNFESFSNGWVDGTVGTYYMQVGGSGVYNFSMSNYYFNTQVSGIHPYDASIKNFTSPPFKNRRDWYGAFYV